MRVLARNANVSATALAQFPKDAALSLASDRPTLVVLADPRGANTRQSLNELAQLMSASQGKMKAYVLFARPADGGPNWTDTDVWRAAASIPGVVPVGDEDGRETRPFRQRNFWPDNALRGRWSSAFQRPHRANPKR